MIICKKDNVEEFNCNTEKSTKHTFEGSLLKLTATFNRKWYVKYDKFKFGDSCYICISNPRKNKDNNWEIDVIPEPITLKDEYDTEFLGSTLEGLFL